MYWSSIVLFLFLSGCLCFNRARQSLLTSPRHSALTWSSAALHCKKSSIILWNVKMNMLMMAKQQLASFVEHLFVGMPPSNRFLQDVWGSFHLEWVLSPSTCWFWINGLCRSWFVINTCIINFYITIHLKVYWVNISRPIPNEISENIGSACLIWVSQFPSYTIVNMKNKGVQFKHGSHLFYWGTEYAFIYDKEQQYWFMKL